MVITENPSIAAARDAELVAESLAGGREAFREIVDRHQTLVCSLAYCATGSLTESEDVAQETFLVAWKQLAELREPAKLRPWLCGIARFIIGKKLRRQKHEPIHAAGTLESLDGAAAPGPNPAERAISKEEQAVLWKCVEGLPEIYREPLVLFYREQQSIEVVAQALELSEDAVKQRLTRGRKLLHERTLAFVEGALQSTHPDSAFTGKVLSALPIAVTPAKALAAGAAVKGSSSVKIVASVAAIGTILLYWSTLGFLAFAGISAGIWMSRAAARSAAQCENAMRFWRALAWSFATSFVLRHYLDTLYQTNGIRSAHGWAVARAMIYWKIIPDLVCVAIVVALAVWMRRWWLTLLTGDGEVQEPAKELKKRFMTWLALGMIGPACIFQPALTHFLWSVFEPGRVHYLDNAQLAKIVAERKDAYYTVMTGEDGTKTAAVVLPENNPGSILWRTNHTPKWWDWWMAGSEPDLENLWALGNAPHWAIQLAYWTGWGPMETRAADSEYLIKLLDEKGIHYGAGFVHPMSREAWPFGMLLPFFIAPMGGVVLLRLIVRRRTSSTSSYSRMLLTVRNDTEAARIFGKVFAVVFLLVFAANAVTATKVFTGWGFYTVFFAGTVKGAFFGMLGGVCALYWRGRSDRTPEIHS